MNKKWNLILTSCFFPECVCVSQRLSKCQADITLNDRLLLESVYGKSSTSLTCTGMYCSALECQRLSMQLLRRGFNPVSENS